MHRKLLLLSAVVFALVSCGVGTKCFASTIEEADGHRAEKEYSQAEAIYKAIVQDYPGTDKAFTAQRKLIILYMAWGKETEAEAAYEQLVSEFGGREDLAGVLVGEIAGAFRVAEKYESAKKVYEYVVSRWPTDKLALEAAQENEIRDALSTCMNQVRQRIPDECSKVDAVREKYGLAIVPFLEEYMADVNEHVRWQSYRSMILVGVDSNDVVARRGIVYELLTGMQGDVRNRGYLANRLLQFEAADFSTEAKQLVQRQFEWALDGGMTREPRDIFLLVGVADLKSELPRLKQFVEEREQEVTRSRAREVEERQKSLGGSGSGPGGPQRWLERQWWQGTLVWAALRARARMGIKEDIQRCIELADSHPNEDYKVSHFLKELAYVRQPEVVDYIYDYLKSDKVEKWKARDVIGNSYAERAAMALAEMLPGFPGRKDIGGDAKTIERCRKWMAEQRQKLEQEKKQWDIIR